MKYIQSFYTYPVTFSSIGKGVPSKDADGELRNIAEFTDEEIEKLERCEPMYRYLIEHKKYRLLNKLPESYKPAALLVNEANERAAKAEAELAALKADRGAIKEPSQDQDLAKMEYKELQEEAKALGIDYKNVKKADLIAKIEEARK